MQIKERGHTTDISPMSSIGEMKREEERVRRKQLSTELESLKSRRLLGNEPRLKRKKKSRREVRDMSASNDQSLKINILRGREDPMNAYSGDSIDPRGHARLDARSSAPELGTQHPLILRQFAASVPFPRIN